MDNDSKIFVAGSNGLVGSAIKKTLEDRNYNHVYWVRRKTCDLTSRIDVESYFSQSKPEYVFLSAAKVGGIGVNIEQPAEFLYDNLMIQANIIDAAYRHGVKKLLFFGSANTYPEDSLKPITEDSLLSGRLEKATEPYAIAKIAGLKLCETYRKQYGCNFIAVQPSNVYGPTREPRGHVIATLLDKFHKAKVNNEHSVTCWGSGVARREFIYADDIADASIFLMQNYDECDIINIGSGEEISIFDLASKIASVVGYEGTIEWDRSKPDGILTKLLDNTKLSNLGWTPSTSLDEGLKLTYQRYTQEN